MPPRTIDSDLDKWKMASDRAVGQVGNPPRTMSERDAGVECAAADSA